jgi:hypothetical protein
MTAWEPAIADESKIHRICMEDVRKMKENRERREAIDSNGTSSEQSCMQQGGAL